MKQKLQNKKGFTLVELMIVVVIMGILVAVAIPVYNAATKNTKVKSCDANRRVIEENLSSYIMTGNKGEAFTDTTIVKTGADDYAFNGALGAALDATKWPTNFVATFKGNKAPVCPFNKAGASQYTILIKKNATGDGLDYEVACTESHS